MKTYSGRNLFPDQNQIYRIRNVVKSIVDEAYIKYNINNYEQFCEYINHELNLRNYTPDDMFTPALVSRLVLFGKTSTNANSLKTLEHLPLLHLVSDKYSEDDLKRIALGQPIKNDADYLLVSKQWLNDMKSVFIEAIAAIELVSNPLVGNIKYDINMSSEDKFNIYSAIINYDNNLNWLLGSGIITYENIALYNNTQQIPDEILIYMLSNCNLPNVVNLYFRKQIGVSLTKPAPEEEPNLNDIPFD